MLGFLLLAIILIAIAWAAWSFLPPPLGIIVGVVVVIVLLVLLVGAVDAGTFDTCHGHHRC